MKQYVSLNASVILAIFLALFFLMLPACTQRTKFVEVKVPVPVACEIEDIDPSPLPEIKDGMNIFELSQVRMAQIAIMAGDLVAYEAANSNPCPAGEVE